MVDEPGSKLSFFLPFALSLPLSISLAISLLCVLCWCTLPCVFLCVERCVARSAASNNHGITARPVPSTGCDEQENVVGLGVWKTPLRRTGTRIKIKETLKKSRQVSRIASMMHFVKSAVTEKGHSLVAVAKAPRSRSVSGGTGRSDSGPVSPDTRRRRSSCPCWCCFHAPRVFLVSLVVSRFLASLRVSVAVVFSSWGDEGERSITRMPQEGAYRVLK